MLGCEVGAGLAPFSSELVSFFQGNLVVTAVAHPQLEYPFDVHLHYLLASEAVASLEQLGEYRVIERLGAHQADRKDEAASDLSRLARGHDRRSRRLTSHAHEGDALGTSRYCVGVRERVR